MNIPHLRVPGEQRKIVFTISLLFLLVCPLITFAQDPSPTEPTYRRWSLQGAIGNHTIGYPFQNYAASFNPSLSLETDFRLNKNPRHTFSIGLANTWLFNQPTGNTLIVQLGFAYRYTHRSGVFGKIGLDLGNSFFFHSGEAYAYNAETQSYSIASNSFATSYSGYQLSLGYDLDPKMDLPWAFFLRNRFGIQSPYFDADLFPILPQNFLELGIIYRFRKPQNTPQ